MSAYEAARTAFDHWEQSPAKVAQFELAKVEGLLSLTKPPSEADSPLLKLLRGVEGTIEAGCLLRMVASTSKVVRAGIEEPDLIARRERFAGEMAKMCATLGSLCTLHRLDLLELARVGMIEAAEQRLQDAMRVK